MPLRAPQMLRHVARTPLLRIGAVRWLPPASLRVVDAGSQRTRAEGSAAPEDGPTPSCRQVSVPLRVSTYRAYSEVLPVMNRRLRLEPPKHTLEMISGMRMTPMRVPSGENTCTPS